MEDLKRQAKPIRPVLRKAPLIIQSRKRVAYGTHRFTISRVARMVTQIRPVKKRRLKSAWQRISQVKKTRTWYLNDLHRMVTHHVKKNGVTSSVLGDVNDAVTFLLGHKKQSNNSQHDPTAMYLHDVGYKTLLTADQEYQLAL